jgi:hypothetical protein
VNKTGNHEELSKSETLWLSARAPPLDLIQVDESNSNSLHEVSFPAFQLGTFDAFGKASIVLYMTGKSR